MKHKGDFKIGKRMVGEIHRLFPDKTNEEICTILNVSRQTFWNWNNGSIPGGYFLAKILAYGGDVEYILSGKLSIS